MNCFQLNFSKQFECLKLVLKYSGEQKTADYVSTVI